MAAISSRVRSSLWAKSVAKPMRGLLLFSAETIVSTMKGISASVAERMVTVELVMR